MDKLNTNSGSGNSGQYSFNGNGNDVLQNSDNGVVIKIMLSDTGLFNSSTISNIVNSSTQNVVGIIQATKVGTTTTVIGYTKETFSSGGGEWLIYGTQGRSYSNTTSNPSKYSCYVSNGSDYGIYVSPTAINDDLMLYRFEEYSSTLNFK